MKLIIEARFEDAGGVSGPPMVVGEIERHDGNLADLGLTLAQGRDLLGPVQSRLVSQQALAHKDTRSIIVRTVFGKMAILSPRWWVCRCGTQGRRESFSPMSKVLTRRTTLELECLQTKWAAHLPYRQANSLLKEVLPLNQAMSFGTTRRRVLALGQRLDQTVEHDIAQHRNRACASVESRESKDVACVAVDSAWLTLYASPKSRRAQHADEQLHPLRMKQVWSHLVNIVAGRATFARRPARLYGYVHNEVASAADRLDQFLRAGGVQPDERLTVISDDAGEFVKSVRGSELARGRILDWFHIAMKFKAAENSVRGSKHFELHERDRVCDWLHKAQWLVWHGKGRQAVARGSRASAKSCWPDPSTRTRPCGGTCADCISTSTTTIRPWSTTVPGTARACRSAAASRSRPSTCWCVTEWPRSSRCAGPTKGHTISFRFVWLR